MGVGIHLAARYPIGDAGESAADWLEQIASWLESQEAEPLMVCRQTECEQGEPAILVQVHPGAEELELCVPEAGRLIASAKTSTAGAGFHIFIADLLQRLGRHFDLEWQDPDQNEGTGDETGYFFAGNAHAVRDEMLRWLGALANVVIDEKLAEDSHVRMVSMPLGYSYPEQQGILTPMGPRTREWFREVADEPARGIDFFPWWSTGIGSAFFLGRAMCRLWQDVRWRPPITEAEGELLMDVHLDLERAYRRDADAPIPWREWCEILDYLREHFGYVEFQEATTLESEIQARAARALGGPRIGYRRGLVQVSLNGGWSITIPGDLAEDWDAEGQAWVAWYGGRLLRFMSWSVRDGEHPEPARQILADIELPDGEILEHQDGAVHGLAVFRRHESASGPWNLHAYSAVGGSLAYCDITVPNRDDLPWALEVWKSLRH